ncbi:MAG: hypothetical protein WDM78_11060 [Puia sp.]
MYVGVVIATPFSGAHLNPAVTIAMATAGIYPGLLFFHILSRRCSEP